MARAARFLAITQEELTEVTALLCGGTPAHLPVKPVWTVEGNSCGLSTDLRGLKFDQRFHRDDEEGLIVHFKALILDELVQKHGIGFGIVRNSLIAYDHLAVSFAAAYANFDVGGYAWAKLAGMPACPEVAREELLARLKERRFEAIYSRDERRALEDVIREAQDSELMFDVAHAATLDQPGKLLGAPLLLGFKWDALWDLRDSAQRKRVAGALA